MSLRTVQRVERGAPCAKETLQALAAALGLETGALVAAAPVGRDGRVLGLPLLAIALSAAHMFGVKWRPGPGSLIIDGVVLRWRLAQLVVAAMAGGLFTIVAVVVLRERLYQMIGA